MIESGLFLWATTNPALQALMGQSKREQAEKIWSSFYFSYLPKADLINTPIPGIVMDVIPGGAGEEEDTLDARSASPPWTPISRIFQFGSVAVDQAQNGPPNPWNPSGYLSAAYLSQTLYRQLMAMATGRASLPDGTVLQDVRYLGEYDAHYEVGDVGYLFRHILHVAITYVPG